MSQHEKVVHSFCVAAQKLVEHYSELSLAIHNKRNEASLGNELAMQTTLSLLVLWENFVSDIILAYAQSDPRRLIRSAETRVLQSVEKKFGKICSRHVHLTFPRNPSLKMIAAMADDRGRNITAQSASELATRANDLLSGKYAKKFTLEPRDYQFYDYLIAVRNYLGHFSTKALRTLREAIQRMQHSDNVIFQARFTQIGPYLRADAGAGSSRTELIGKRLDELARKM